MQAASAVRFGDEVAAQGGAEKTTVNTPNSKALQIVLQLQ